MAIGFRTSAVIDCRTRKTESVEYLAEAFGLIYHKRQDLWTWFDQPTPKQRVQGKRRYYVEQTKRDILKMFRAHALATVQRELSKPVIHK